MSLTEASAFHKRCASFAQLSETLGALLIEYSKGQAPHSLLLCGPYGVGKRNLAQILAMSLVCQSLEKPCGQCIACRRMIHGNHGNLISLSLTDKERTIKVDAVRSIINQLSAYPPEEGRRVVLLFDMDAFTPQAQNALLKAVEEPDASTFFILTAVSEQAVLPTIRSRCRLLRVPPWPPEMMQELLADHGFSPKEAKQLTLQSGGSPGKALLLRNNPDYAAIKTLADSILAFRNIKELPLVSNQLKEAKDVSDMLLNYLELAALSPKEHGLPLDYASRLSQTVPLIRKQSASYVNWQTLVDTLLLSVLEDN